MTSSQWSDLDRPPLRGAQLERAVLRPGGLWTSLRVVAETGSTNSDLVARAAEGAEAGTVLVAEEQTAGRGRLERSWSAPARSGIFLSMLLRPSAPKERWGWLPLLVGVSAASALSQVAGVEVRLKWPNDLLVQVGGEERKLGGILAELAGDAVVVGIGLNVSLREDELPVPAAGSLLLAGAAVTDRETLLRALLRTFDELYTDWAGADGEPEASGLRAAYAAQCATLGRQVRVELPGGRELLGEAVAVDGDGRLVVRDSAGEERAVGAGDVLHVRPQQR
ncbi:biotin--[acetyl-CoA-carboxylase] ligase [Streptacidiphilus carbonis]|jgi:BirA family transcriptional regulator, biotin operon repressor / biotin---[acetyl-CoA-carboxylase] ligase|uniref:biotin--[acetyl-CoA-carboxylase] ligase n=1 Tax=Streptacidiphilus carbonis TaxID=105422 RepID=UPI0005A77F6C|nr:biotin--[acetyl-CoA-carboxylase] ligase [Streptacidiphilus carbonis]